MAEPDPSISTWLPAPEAPRPRPPYRLRPSGGFFRDAPLTLLASPDEWAQPPPRPALAPQAARPGWWAGVLEPSLFAPVALDWMAPPAQRPPPARPPAPGLSVLAPEPLPLPLWSNSALPSGAVVARSAARAAYFTNPAPPGEAISTLEKWQPASAGPRRPRLLARPGWFALPTEVVPEVLFSWHNDSCAIVRRRPQLQPLRPILPLLVETPRGWEPLSSWTVPGSPRPRPSAALASGDPATVGLSPALPLFAVWQPLQRPRSVAPALAGAAAAPWRPVLVTPDQWYAEVATPPRRRPRHSEDAPRLWVYAPVLILPGRGYWLRWSRTAPALLLWNAGMAIHSEINVYKGEDALLHFSPEEGPVNITTWLLAAALSRRVGLSADAAPLLVPPVDKIDPLAGTYSVLLTSTQLQTANAGLFELDVWRDDDGLRSVLAHVRINVKTVARW